MISAAVVVVAGNIEVGADEDRDVDADVVEGRDRNNDAVGTGYDKEVDFLKVKDEVAVVLIERGRENDVLEITFEKDEIVLPRVKDGNLD